MAKEHIIPITNGKGSKEIIDGTYDVTADVDGYDNSTINPSNQIISNGIDTYNFTIAATGTLTLHVSDDGTTIGIPIIGAKFVRCDNVGNQYGTEIITDDQGNAVFNNVPYSATNTPVIYFKQLESDGEHTFDDALQSTELETTTKTVEIENPDANTRNFNLTDANYSGLPISDGNIILTEK